MCLAAGAAAATTAAGSSGSSGTSGTSGTTGTSGTSGTYNPATGSSATGDPHFRVTFPGEALDICFDLDGPNGKIFNLIHDPQTNLVINAEIVDHGVGHHHAHRLGKIGVISPAGNKVFSPSFQP